MVEGPLRSFAVRSVDVLVKADWKALAIAQEKFPDDPLMKEWVGNMKRDFAEDYAKWPEIGCKSQFYPYQRPVDGGGASHFG